MKGYNSLFFLVCVVITLSAQDRLQLEQERMQVIASIEETDLLIQDSESDRQKSLATLSALRGQITQRNDLLNNIKKSISSAELQMESNQVSLDSLSTKVGIIQKQYGLLLRTQYLKKISSSKWLSILSAGSINEAFLRWNYNRQFESYRQSKLNELNNIKEKVEFRNEEIKKYALENSALIQEQQIQNSELQNRIEQQNDLIKDLQKDKSILQSQLSAIKQARESLNQAIESKVLGELSGSVVGFDKNQLANTKVNIIKGKVSLPITSGYVEDLFLDDSSRPMTISIHAAKRASVIPIAIGEVISIDEVEGYGNMIILQHGEYYSVYAKLKKVYVEVGDKVEESSKLGDVDNEERTLHFELWKDKVRLDANEWIEG